MTIKVVYDISVIGYGQQLPNMQTGVVRAAEHVCIGLARSPDCDLLFYPGALADIVDGCIDYVRGDPLLSASPLLFTGWRCLRRSFQKARDEPAVAGSESFFSILGRRSNSRWGDLQVRKRMLRRVGMYADDLIERYLYPFDVRRIRDAEIFHTPVGPIPPIVRQAPRTRNLLTVHDMIPELHPEYCNNAAPRYHAQCLESLCPEDWVICDSRSTRNDFLNLIRFDPDRVFVIPLAASPDLFFPCTDAARISELRMKYGIPDGPYVLALHAFEPRKNIDGVIRSFVNLVQSQHIPDLSLILVGPVIWREEHIHQALANAGEFRNRIHVLGQVPDAELAPLYSGALVFVYPSFYEGFGLPPLEAMQCGVPVITSNNSSLPEVVGDAAILVDPSDGEALSQSMYEVYRDARRREQLSKKSLEQARLFSWDKCVQATLAAYKTALAR